MKNALFLLTILTLSGTSQASTNAPEITCLYRTLEVSIAPPPAIHKRTVIAEGEMVKQVSFDGTISFDDDDGNYTVELFKKGGYKSISIYNFFEDTQTVDGVYDPEIGIRLKSEHPMNETGGNIVSEIACAKDNDEAKGLFDALK